MSNLDALHAKVDTFFAAVHARHRQNMACASGCSDCCQKTLSLFPVELATLEPAVKGLPAAERARIHERAVAGGETCPLLEDDRCVAYAARPTICRSHGLPIRYLDDNGQAHRDVCPKNFTGDLPLQALPATDLLDVERTNQVLVLINQLTLTARSADQPVREDLRSALRRWLQPEPSEADPT